ncbi:MAG TPA: ribonuclease D [Woeseiaceae bacterium]|jgi:ribonuclease D|nr:ribonuclease D [Woeseiaceae bacterium]
MPRFNFVEEPDSLVDALRSHGQLAVDTEFMRESTYYAQLCLTQISAGGEIWCVDPIAGHTQDAFWQELLSHDWVLHSARQDIEVIYQLTNKMPASIFDTQVAAGLLGLPAQVGYAGLVQELFDVEIHKVHTRADWSRRPLRNEYLEYAAEDVEYLLPACEILVNRLEEKGRIEWAREDSAWLLDPALYVNGDGQAIDRLKGARNFRGRKRAAAARLAEWRENEAIKRNRPRQWIMRDSILLDIAWKLPKSEQELADIQGVPPKLVRRAGRRLLDEIASSAADERDYTPLRPPGEGQKALLKEMQSRVAACAEDLGVAAETVASKRELSGVIINGNRQSRLFSGWRAELIGEELLELL